MIKKTLICIVTLLLVASASYVAGRYQEKQGIVVENVELVVNEKAVQLKETDGSAIHPISYKGRMYLPVSAVAELVNYDMDWNEKTGSISMKNRDVTEEEEGMGYASIAATAYSTGKALEGKDYNTLATLAHPAKGIRFSINGKVEKDIDIVLTKAELENSGIGKKTYTWGVEDGSDEPMVKTVDDFMVRFQKDFENPTRDGWNERVTGYGIKEQTQKAVKVIEGGESLYAESEFVEYFFEGDSELEFDWNSYIFIFELYEGKYYLVGVLHNYWLI